jgi:putative ABC transport system ATP-binding protein
MATETTPELVRTPSEALPDAVRLDHVSKVYGRGEGAVIALDRVTVELRSGSFTAVMGPSGSGKSTFLHCAAGLDAPTSGNVRLGGADVGGLSEAKRTALRRERIGFIFQAFNLLPWLTVEQNISLPLRLAGRRPDRAWSHEVVERVGLKSRLKHRPAQLSGGQQQRVAIARALLTHPEVVFADEPTGALDTRTSGDILALLRHVVDALGQTVVMVTHDPLAAAYADRVLYLADGAVVAEDVAPTADTVAERMTHLGA